MKTKSRILSVALSIIFFMVGFSTVSSADSGLFVEPAIQYIAGSGSLSTPYGLANSTTSTYGLGFDLKAGAHFTDMLFAGLDGTYASPQYIDGGNSYSASANLQELGVVVGAQMPIVGLRVWGDYIFTSVLDPAASGNGLDLKFRNGTGFKLGAGFHILLISLNLEYEDVTYGTTDIQSVGNIQNVTTTNSISLHDKRWIVGVSIPLNL